MRATGRALASNLAFCLFVFAGWWIVEGVCQNRNRIAEYPNFTGFPLMVQQGQIYGFGGYEPNFELVSYPFQFRRLIPFGTPNFLLPKGKSSPGVFMGNHVSFEVQSLGEGRQRIVLRNWSRSMNVPWRKAVYEATVRSVQPLSISGGFQASHPLASLAAALLFALFLNRFGRYIALAATDASPRQSLERLRRAPLHEDPFAFLILLPFLYYWWESLNLVPYNMADSYAYLWRRSLNGDFLTGRCLSQRAVFRLLCGANLRVVATIQLLAFAGTATLVYAMTRRHVGLLVRLGLAAATIFLFSSYTFNIHAVVVSSEPLFLAIAIVFPLVVFLWPLETRHWAVLGFGVFFVFSKNVAPFLTIAVVALAILSDSIHRRHFPALRMLPVYAVLGVVSLVSMVVTQRRDVAVDMNTLNNICRRVLTKDEATRYFIEHYGMPDGAYIPQVRGGDANSYLDGKRLYRVSSETMNFVMLKDQYGFIEWVQDKGRSSFLNYIFWVRPLASTRELLDGWRRFVVFNTEVGQDSDSPMVDQYYYPRVDPIRYVITDLGPRDYADVPNIARLVRGDAKRQIGFWGFDSIELMKNALLWLGLGRYWVVLLFAVTALIAGTIVRRAHWLPAGGGVMLFGLTLFFVCFFGDSAVVARHLFPGVVVVVVGGWITLLGAVELVCRLFMDRRKRRKTARSEPPSGPVTTMPGSPNS
jgi:hypothetical protein